ncbi:glucose dehydrogenase [Pseudoclavibacter sp. AY1F1]|uniref:PQQ-dependent sugar dehydrogenase n=1 Tax=Pseudoclavibacter sp. AY1F1 TaxID=2080583 RepID=UPI000CE7F3BA|nr:PQQ-dependent sugar dehydrogenase [Pseudoclavibacter sp. AY1F1]PPF46086.1 glucose dehydrogenase [Pseudoclavibacter sp. AY1F1]
MTKRSAPFLALAAVAALALAGCTPSGPQAEPTQTGSASPSPASTAPASTADESASTAAADPGPVTPNGDPRVVTTGLQAPWSVVELETGDFLVSERDTGQIVEVSADGSNPNRVVTTIGDVVPDGEGGLLGLALAGSSEDAEQWLYAFYTGASDNRIVRFPVTWEGGIGVGVPEVIVDGIAKAGNHNGGRLAIGPDGYLYASTGDASQTELAQDQNSLNGKILRMELDGSPVSDNPFGNRVYSMGHRNPQGLAFDGSGGLWASEFGQNMWDELNKIEAGGNYGWPTVEGQGDDPAFLNPVLQWPTNEASPSGLAYSRGTLFMAGLGGERLWKIAIPEASEASDEALYVDEFGRLRDAVVTSQGTLLVLTNNTDGRGSPREGDDTLLEFTLSAS